MPKTNFLHASIALAISVVAASSYAQQQASQPTTAKPVAENSRLVISSAKTIRDLLQTDDALALVKERKALADEEKKVNKALGDPNAAADAKAQNAKSDAEFKAAIRAEAKRLAETIQVTSIVGIQGQRIVSANIGGKPSALQEGKTNYINGWKLVQIQAECAVFERQKPNEAKKKATNVKQRKTDAPTIDEKRACFTKPETAMAMQGLPLTSMQGNQAIPLPIPMQPGALQRPGYLNSNVNKTPGAPS